MNAANKILGLLAEQQKSREELASALGVTTRTLYTRFKTGNFSIEEAERVGKFFGVNPQDIFLR